VDLRLNALDPLPPAFAPAVAERSMFRMKTIWLFRLIIQRQ
jgi:hypothetical protein